MLITRLSKADKKNWRGRSLTIRRWFAELSDLWESKRDTEISLEIPPRYWKVYSKNRNNFRKGLFSQNWIDNQSPLYVTKFRKHSQADNTPAAQWYHWPLSDTKFVDSMLFDVMLQSQNFLRLFLIFWSKHNICITQKNMYVDTYTWQSVTGSSWELIWRPSGLQTNMITTRLCFCNDALPMFSKSELGLLISITYYRSKRFFSMF